MLRVKPMPGLLLRRAFIEVFGENSAEYTRWSNLEKRQVARSDQEF